MKVSHGAVIYFYSLFLLDCAISHIVFLLIVFPEFVNVFNIFPHIPAAFSMCAVVPGQTVCRQEVQSREIFCSCVAEL